MSDESTNFPTIDETARRDFEQAYQSGVPVSIEECLPAKDDAKYLPTLQELVLIEMELFWKGMAESHRVDLVRSDERIITEHYLQRFPELEHPTLLRRIAKHEFTVRNRFGDRPPASEFRSRFPDIFRDDDNWSAPPAKESDERKRFGNRYSIKQMHAKGGIGRVWLAQDQKIGREIALKELLAKRATLSEASARFTAEAKITGQLEHPNIVPVYEISESDDGHPFYTMRFVRGETLTDVTAEYHAKKDAGKASSLDLVRLLNAFISVCNAVDYAHARGVLHRDLKGQNVVLGNFGEVFVLDWGLAKFVDRNSSSIAQPIREIEIDDDSIGHTYEGQVVGTPAYMSPEQAAGRLQELDQRTDVYGLGAILYQILTGKPPLEGASSKGLLERIIEDQPVQPREIQPGIARPLEAICLHALEKRPEDRYALASQLADDVQRFLADEAVSVYPESWQERCTRWARRNRAWAQAVAVALILVCVVSVVSAILVNHARQKEARERERAETNFRQARDAVDQFLTRVGQGPLANTPQMQNVGRLLLEDALKYYQTFLEQKENDLQVRLDTARAMRRVADIRRKLGQHEQARKDYQEALTDQLQLIREFPDSVECKFDVSETYTNQGHLFQDVNEDHAAEKAFTTALEIAQGLFGSGQTNFRFEKHRAVCFQNLGAYYANRNKLANAEAHYHEARKIQEKLVQERPEIILLQNQLARTWNNLGLLYRNDGRLNEAEMMLRKSIELKRKLVADYALESDFRHDLANSLNTLGIVYGEQEKDEDAADTYNEAIKLQERLASDFPSILEYQSQLGSSLHNLSDQLLAEGQNESAHETIRRAILHQTAALRGNPRNADYRHFLRNHVWVLCDVLAELGDHAELSHAAASLPTIISNWEENQRAALFMAKCVAIASNENELEQEQKSSLLKNYRDQCFGLIKTSIELGHPDLNRLRECIEFDVLRSGEDFQSLFID